MSTKERNRVCKKQSRLIVFRKCFEIGEVVDRMFCSESTSIFPGGTRVRGSRLEQSKTADERATTQEIFESVLTHLRFCGFFGSFLQECKAYQSE